MRIAEVKHQAHVAPMTNGSRKVRNIENNKPKVAMPKMAKEATFDQRVPAKI
jgi:hypothetical protein